MFPEGRRTRHEPERLYGEAAMRPDLEKAVSRDPGGDPGGGPEPHAGQATATSTPSPPSPEVLHRLGSARGGRWAAKNFPQVADREEVASAAGVFGQVLSQPPPRSATRQLIVNVTAQRDFGLMIAEARVQANWRSAGSGGENLAPAGQQPAGDSTPSRGPWAPPTITACWERFSPC